ncbi:signal peptidase I [Polaribacter litorisediminis]|uniref:signal peptidase I n=1 Tax=Polaribacter litorisediminis TaxID=1908341 RepID=UPI001CBBCE77|nr:signal peptidase I [Polaribacter litorisediminis]UAM98053.1 signal peptidase I [Polaribacter litorisediminis]
MVKLFKKGVFILGVIGVLLFLLWSKLLIVSLVLLIVLDTITLNKIYFFLKTNLSKIVLSVIRYVYIIILPILFAVFIRTFFFDVYYVPSSSMERTLYPGDYVLINKISYGVKLPNHLRNLPVLGTLFVSPENEFNLYTLLKSFKDFKREDIVVFKAVDNSDKFLIKRIIGVSGDTIEIKKTNVYINSKELKQKQNYTYSYIFKQKNNVTLHQNYSNKEYVAVSDKERKNYKKKIEEKTNHNYFLFPVSKQNEWTRDNYGEIVIPKKGMKIKLTEENIAFYNTCAVKFENTDLSKLKNTTYTFKNNYFFMMGDNRHNSIDSRSFGFVPESYIQGKMFGVF